MASPDEARVDEARDQSNVPEPTTAAPETPVAPPRRPRGAASFPGGPPPVAPAPAAEPAPPAAPPAPAPPPRFRVTTVDSAGASFPGGPPPPAPPPRDDPAPVATAPPRQSPDRAREAPRPGPAREAPRPGPAARPDPARPDPEPGGTPAPEIQAEAGDADGPTATGDPGIARTGGRRRRRGGRGRSTPNDPAAGPTGAAAALVGELDDASDDAPEAASDDQPDGAGSSSVPGSARTRARRRRRAAAKARGPALAGDDADEPPASETATVAAVEEPQAGAPTPASRGPRSRRGAAARVGNGEPRPARPVDGEPQATRPTDGDKTGSATRTAGDHGPSRTRRRGRGGRSAAADADAAPGSAEAPAEAAAGDRADTKEPQGRGRGAGTERSTRLENRTKAQGARQADRGRRRRPSGMTEEQKRVLREEGPDKRMVVTEGAERTQIGVLEGPTLVEHYVTRKAGRSMVGNIYLGRVQNVLPGMEAAFIDIGRGRNAVLYAGEVNYNEEDLDGEAPRIEKVLKPGQPVLVQVTKDPIGAKGARLTAQVSLAGRYLVLQPEDNTFGISRRLPEAERSRLRDILKEVRPKGLGLIVRTAAEGASADDLRADLARLQARWETVERKAKKASAPAAIYSEPELVVRVIRDIFSPDFVELVVEGEDLFQRVEEYLQEVAPDLLPKLRRHDGKLPVFEHYRVVEQIHKALERKVWLPSGGSIVIDRTEAMTVVDVNTGKFVGRGAGANLEETVVANNLEAADEIVRQLRLRDIGGIIIIDFIDMLFERNQEAVVERLRSALVMDKTKSQVMEVSSLGLVQMTRKRVSGGLLDSFSETCPTCDGRGVVITHEI
jgi:ribonuclease E